MSAEIESISTERGPRQASARSTSPWLAALAGLALLLAAFAHLRLNQSGSRDDRLRGQLADVRQAQVRLERQANALTNRVDAEQAALRRQLATLGDLPTAVTEFERNLDELRARTESPQRAWVGAEAAYLLDLAQRRLEFERDVVTAIAAMSAADARLATLSDPAVTAVRRELAREIAALRAVEMPDVPALLARLDRLDAGVATLPVQGIPAERLGRGRVPNGDSEAGAAERVAAAGRELFSLRRVETAAARLVTLEEEALRRQHLRLLLLSARIAAMQRDQAAYASALSGAQAWLIEHFDPRAAAVEAMHGELRQLAELQLDPARPAGIGTAARMLQRVARAAPDAPPARR